MSLSNDEVVATHEKKQRKEKVQKAKKAKSDESDFRPAENIVRKKVADIIEMEIDRKKKKKKEKKDKDKDKDKDKEPVVDLEGAKEIKSFIQGAPEIEMVKQAEGEFEVISEKNKEGKRKGRERRRNSELDSEGAPTARRNKRKREESENADTEDMQGEDSKKKKPRNNTGFPDPVEEALLSDQARLALTYAFKQFRKPSKWKFMKSRQNWIIRNWATDNVGKSSPSNSNFLEMPLVLKYLSNVKGNIREHLMRTCESIISTENPAHTSVVTERDSERDDDEKTHPTEKATNPMKVLRAEAMLAMFMDETKFD